MIPDDTDALIRSLWEQFRPLVESRIEAIEQYVAACSPESGDTPAQQRRLETLHARAKDAAHNLAGALGSYGRPDGSTIAAEVNVALEHAVTEVDEVARLVQRLRAAVTDGDDR